MAGALTHIGISLVLYIIVYFIFRKHLYGTAVFLGHIFPDAFKFGITGIWIKSISYYETVRQPMFHSLDMVSSGWVFYVVLIAGISIISLGLYKIGKLKKEEVKLAILSSVLFTAGAVIHIIIDLFVKEKNPWI